METLLDLSGGNLIFQPALVFGIKVNRLLGNVLPMGYDQASHLPQAHITWKVKKPLHPMLSADFAISIEDYTMIITYYSNASPFNLYRPNVCFDPRVPLHFRTNACLSPVFRFLHGVVGTGKGSASFALLVEIVDVDAGDDAARDTEEQSGDEEKAMDPIRVPRSLAIEMSVVVEP